jgi:hypothetical protein
MQKHIPGRCPATDLTPARTAQWYQPGPCNFVFPIKGILACGCGQDSASTYIRHIPGSFLPQPVSPARTARLTRTQGARLVLICSASQTSFSQSLLPSGLHGTLPAVAALILLCFLVLGRLQNVSISVSSVWVSRLCVLRR